MNDYGQIGSGSNEKAVVPRFVECLDGVSKITCGANHNLALRGDGRLFQWGCGRACGNTRNNILCPEEVKLPDSNVKDIDAGCWHSLLLTDCGNVFSWGMGQEGQLGLGESKTCVSIPCLLGYSHLAGVRQIQAGDSYSAAVTADGELYLWGRIPHVSRDSDPPGFRRVWTPQFVPLGGRKVFKVACGTWHMMALTTRSRDTKWECALTETGARFKDLVCNPPPMERTEKENIVQDLRHVRNKLHGGPGKPEGSGEQEDDEESKSAEEGEGDEERAKEEEGDGALHNPAVAAARSPTEKDGAGNGRSSIKSDKWDGGESGRTAGPGELRREWCTAGRGGEVVFTTLHLLPKSEGQRRRPRASALPVLLTGQQSCQGVVAEAQQVKPTHQSELVHKSASDGCILLSPRPRPKPRPPNRWTGLEPQTGKPSCYHPSTRPVTSLKSLTFNRSSDHLSLGLSAHPWGQEQVQIFSPLPPGPRPKISKSPTPSTSGLSRHRPILRRAISSSSASWRDASESRDPVLPHPRPGKNS
ncbi:protein pim1-like isoform X3 [Myripristis murdjan]|uniref:protein pim1-like isoform X3 n=1 Tax=Myripristis murdjan TaxID=586833 RepID=UPI001175EEF7|nr:protein pim1-like isoform X3 [Myripristis murdjan]